jgi:hypothetical protein
MAAVLQILSNKYFLSKINTANSYTVKPIYNLLGYNEFLVITEHIVFTDSIHFSKN